MAKSAIKWTKKNLDFWVPEKVGASIEGILMPDSLQHVTTTNGDAEAVQVGDQLVILSTVLKTLLMGTDAKSSLEGKLVHIEYKQDRTSAATKRTYKDFEVLYADAPDENGEVDKPKTEPGKIPE